MFFHSFFSFIFLHFVEKIDVYLFAAPDPLKGCIPSVDDILKVLPNDEVIYGKHDHYHVGQLDSESHDEYLNVQLVNILASMNQL